MNINTTRNHEHELPVSKLLSEYNVDPTAGLLSVHIPALRTLHGLNMLPPPEKKPFWKLVLSQFEDLLVRILLIAAIISFVLALSEFKDLLTSFIEPSVIMLILIANAIVGVIQESRAEKAIEKLKEFEALDANCFRDGKLSVISASELVPGDIVRISQGEKVPADIRLISLESSDLLIDQSILTGESLNVHKSPEPVMLSDALIQDKTNILFSGTLITKGNGKGIVIGTGSNTAIGTIHHHLSSEEEGQTPLQAKLDEFGELLSKIIGAICLIVWLININHFSEHGSVIKGAIYYFKIAVALAVAAIPEGLPAVVTTCLALGTMRMARKHAIVRRLPSVETLGCTTIICSDKTGTLTTNMMSVQRVFVPETNVMNPHLIKSRVYEVSGDSWAPMGIIRDANTKAELAIPAIDSSLNEIAKVCTLCNDAHLEYNGVNFSKIGTATESALKVLSEKILVNDDQLVKQLHYSNDPSLRTHFVEKFWTSIYTKKATLEFTRERKSMSVLVSSKDSTELLVKGAPESILDRSSFLETNDLKKVPMSPALKDTIMNHVLAFASQGLRCLAFAKRIDPPSNANYNNEDSFESIESNLTFIGLVGMLDPPRAEVVDSIKTCFDAGIRVVVITGDNQKTAEEISKRIGLFPPESTDDDIKQFSFLGSDLMDGSDKQNEILSRAVLFSRVEPKHKYLLVERLKQIGHVVAMTGDGVNDAPALKHADIGIAMGSGTAVATEASAMILQDDNFSTIVMAVEEGRSIYSNTRQFIRYLISSNIGEVICIFLTAALGIPEALIPVQLLWVNLVTDGLPATALGFNPRDSDIMKHPPRGRSEPIISGWMLVRYFIIGTWVGVATVLGFIWWFSYYSGGPLLTYAQLSSFHSCPDHQGIFASIDCDIFSDAHPSTISLSILVTIEMFNALNAISEARSLLQTPPWKNLYLITAIIISFILHFIILYVPFFQTIFSVAPLNIDEWQAVLLFSLPVIFLDELMKLMSRYAESKWFRLSRSTHSKITHFFTYLFSQPKTHSHHNTIEETTYEFAPTSELTSISVKQIREAKEKK